jgi:hypothetical protein
VSDLPQHGLPYGARVVGAADAIIWCMQPSVGAAVHEQERPERVISCVALVGGWALIGAAACAVTFVVSAIPAPVPDGRSIPLFLQIIEAAFALSMLPFCTLVPIPLLITGHKYLLRSARAAWGWRAAWITAAGASIAVEVEFWFRFVSLLVSGSPGLSYMDWHALDFSASFLAVGGAMAFVLIGATRSATRSSVA